MRDMFEVMDQVLRTHPEVGEYNQKIWATPPRYFYRPSHHPRRGRWQRRM